MQSQHWICERCGSPATICHHIQHLNDETVHNPEIALNWELLEALCHDCHNKEHFQSPVIRSGLVFDETGEIVKQ